MAAPVKNYTDPTTLSRLSPYLPAILIPFTVSQAIMVSNLFAPSEPNYDFPITEFSISKSFPSSISKLQVPSSMMLNTFAPIYRERNGNSGSGSVETPRVFPPIFTLNSL